VLQRKTVRVAGKEACDRVLASQPQVRAFVEAVRTVLALPEWRRNPCANTPAQPKGKAIRAIHFLLQDQTLQSSFSWHDDGTDIGHEGRHMTSVIVSLTDERSAMRIWGLQPYIFPGEGWGVVFAGRALHESVPRRTNDCVPVRKVALFFA
jgi:hypothetical protein